MSLYDSPNILLSELDLPAELYPFLWKGLFNNHNISVMEAIRVAKLRMPVGENSHLLCLVFAGTFVRSCMELRECTVSELSHLMNFPGI